LRFWSLLGWLAVWLVVAWAMLDPAPPMVRAVSDKAIHFACFVAVSFAAVAFCRADRQLALTGFLCVVAGVGLEIAQYFVPGRAFEWVDMAANIGGAFTGTALAALALRGLRRLGWPTVLRRTLRGIV
jgi:VanZ family protein